LKADRTSHGFVIAGFVFGGGVGGEPPILGGG
jgi:hypothetical protein